MKGKVETKTAFLHTLAVDMIGELNFWEFSVWSWGKICRMGGTHPFLVMGGGGTQLSVWEARMLVSSKLRVVGVACG